MAKGRKQRGISSKNTNLEPTIEPIAEVFTEPITVVPAESAVETKSIPQKTKQIGDLDEKVKIYIEDYVYTYLYQYAKTKMSSEKVAFLVGRQYQLNGLDTLVISGAILGKHSEMVDGTEPYKMAMS
ncbi:MAG: hypothetical protein R3Y53_06765, partial [Bacillota bacterium]